MEMLFICINSNEVRKENGKMKRSKCAGIMCLAIVFLLLSITVWAEGDWDRGTGWYFSAGTLSIGVGGSPGNVPDEIKDKTKVVVLLDGVKTAEGFSFWRSIEKVVLPDSLTKIDSSAFTDCWNLKEINLPPNLKEIGDEAFFGCAELENVTLPSGLTRIGNSAFYNCEKLTGDLVIPDSVEDLGTYAFHCCGISGVKLPVKLAEIPAAVFAGCNKLESVTWPDYVFTIGFNAFWGCKLKDVKIPSAVMAISAGAFAFNGPLSSVRIPITIKKIGYAAFSEHSAELKVYYAGAEKQWRNVKFGKYDPDEDNKALIKREVPEEEEFITNSDRRAEVKAFNLIYGDGFDWDQEYEIIFADDGIKPRIVSLYKEKATLSTGGSIQLTASIIPENAEDKSVTWKSSNTAVATVKDGLVKAIKTGKATIIVTTANGKTDTCVVTVTAKKILPKKVSLSKTTATLIVGDKIALKATITPTGATGQKLTWKSSNKNIVTVTSSGTVKAKKAGKATITAFTANGKKATCKVTVKKAHKALKVKKASIKNTLHNISAVKKAAKTVKKGKMTLSVRSGYIKFKAPKAGTYSFAFSDIKAIGDSGAEVTGYAEFYDRNAYEIKDSKVRTTGGKKASLYLCSAAYTTSTKGIVKERYLKSRTGKIKLKKGQVIYIYMDFDSENAKKGVYVNLKIS